MGPYRYKPLPADFSRPIRLLQILPSEDEHAPIQCRLIPFDLQDLEGSRTGSHPYEALSLLWGNSDTTKTVSIESDSLRIEVSLYTALSCLRQRVIGRVIWTDAICINQKDKDEKARQAQYMTEIYARASRVIAWLDEVTGDPQTDSTVRQENYQALHAIASAASDLRTQSGPSKDDYEMVQEFCYREWFTRV